VPGAVGIVRVDQLRVLPWLCWRQRVWWHTSACVLQCGGGTCLLVVLPFGADSNVGQQVTGE
jgi:hypothetical protein